MATNIKELQISLYSLLIQYFIDKEPVQRVPMGTYLFQEKEEVENVYILIQGSVSVGRFHVKGKEFILKILGGEELIIEYQLFTKHPVYHLFTKTMTDCELIVIKKKQFEEYALSEPAVLGAITSWMSTRYLKSQMKCMDLIMNGKKGGLYSILIRLCNSHGILTENGIVIDIPLTHQELANLTYGTREVVQRMLKELRENDVLDYDQQRFTVKNLAYLRKEVDCQQCGREICGIN
nr:Crp/Fnr family transcriptional regulator [uncultured Bacillus sp.]